MPSVIIPFHGDQPFWGKRVAELGIGPLPIPRRQLSVERLVHAIEEVIINQSMSQRAKDIGIKLRAEQGLKNAVIVIHEVGK